MKIGFIGQGWIGKNYADDFSRRGFDIVRYAKEEPYNQNRDLLNECSYFFIAVPTPTTVNGFDFSIVRDVLSYVPEGKVAIIKSTLLPGTTDHLQEAFPKIFVVHSPEFLREKSAAKDAAAPKRNIIGLPAIHSGNIELAKGILRLLPKAEFETVVSAKEAELIKYAGNCFLYTKVIYFNLIYDLALANGLDYESIRQAVAADPRIGDSHTIPVNEAGHRGAGGHCFIKDFEAFRLLYEKHVKDEVGDQLLKAFVNKNNTLLKSSNKDIDLLLGVYGEAISQL